MSGIGLAARGQTDVEITLAEHHPGALFPPPCEWCGTESQFEGPQGTPFCSKDCASRFLGVYPSHIQIREAADERY